MFKIITQKGKEWIDVKDRPVPTEFIPSYEKLCEKKAVQLANKALSLEKNLYELKLLIEKIQEEVYKEFLKKHNEQDRDFKNHTWYNFDRSIRIERYQNISIVFDDALMMLAKEKFQDYLTKKELPEAIVKLITNVFSTSKGKFDPRKVNTLLTFRNDEVLSKDTEFMEAIKILDEAKKEDITRSYDRISIRNDDGKYVSINLSLSSLNPKELVFKMIENEHI